MPNPASWTVWALLATLNAITFWKGSRDALATAQFFTGSAGCVSVWGFALLMGKFSPLDLMAWIVLSLCVIACIVWWITQNAAYANLIVGVWHNHGVERPLPWYLWTAGFMFTTINLVVKRRKGQMTQAGWQLLFVVPIACVVCHGIVALIANF